MKRLLAAVLLAACALPASAARDQWGGFAAHADRGALKPFARDLGSVLGAGTFYSGRSLGFSGFDVGGRFGAQFHPSKGNKILRDQGVRVFGMPWIQAEIGMPFKIDGFIRGISYQGLTVTGGGLRYGVYSESDKPWAPQLLVNAVGHTAVHQHFSAVHGGAGAVLSAGTPAFAPFVGAGVDRTTVEARVSAADPTLPGTEVTTTEARFTAGFRFKPVQFSYLTLAYFNAHGQSGAEAGLGVRF